MPEYVITRRVRGDRPRTTVRRFVIEADYISLAKRLADAMKYQLEWERGFFMSSTTRHQISARYCSMQYQESEPQYREQ